MTEALYDVLVDGRSIADRLGGLLIGVQVSDRAGSSSDTASVELRDPGAALALPAPGRRLEVRLGWRGMGMAGVFAGTVDRVRSGGDRSGARLLVSATGFDTAGPAKAPRSAVFDGLTVREVLERAGALAGVSDVRVDPALGSRVRDREVMDNESFVAFGERSARELGGTFKLRQDVAAMVRRNAGLAPSGAAMPVVRAVRGENLLDWDVEPFVGRGRFARVVCRYYDPATARWEHVEAETGIEGSDVGDVGRFTAPDRPSAEARVEAMKAEAENEAGVGRVTILGDVLAQAEGVVEVLGARPGIDGRYRIEGVDHDYRREGSFRTQITLAHPLPA